MTRTVTLTVRLDEKTKQDLERLASALGVNLSDLLRKYIIPFARISTTLQTLNMIEDLERVVVKAIVVQKEFQELLKELYKRMVEMTFCGGYDCEYEHTYKVIPDTYFLTIIKEGNMYWPARLERYFDDGSIAYERWELEKVETIRELTEWLQDLEKALLTGLREKIKEVKEAVRWLLS